MFLVFLMYSFFLKVRTKKNESELIDIFKLTIAGGHVHNPVADEAHF